jgi:DNA-binding IclR family transcriptional regulator
MINNDSAMPENTKPTRINSVARAMDIMEMVSQGVSRLTDISNRLGLKKSTTHGLLKTLERGGFLLYNPTKRQYHLGSAIIRIGSEHLILHQSLIVTAIEHMERLRRLTGETVILHILVGTYVLALEVLPSRHEIIFTTDKGLLEPAYYGPASRILLGQLGDAEIDAVLRKTNFSPLTEKTVTDRGVFREQVRLAQQQGYYITCGEKVDGSMGIAVPVRNYLYPASLTVIGPEYRLEPAITSIGEEAQKVAAQISAKLKEL